MVSRTVRAENARRQPLLAGHVEVRGVERRARVFTPPRLCPSNGLVIGADDIAGLGIEAVAGVTDGGGNKAAGNGNPLQCTNVRCNTAAAR